MTRTLSWIGWSALLCAALAAFIVTRQFVRPYHEPVVAGESLPTGATLAVVDNAGHPRLMVTSLQTGGPGAEAGLKVGDEIEDVDGLPAPSLTAFDRDVASGSYDVVDLRVSRHGALLDIHMRRGGGGHHG
ncbi:MULTISPECIES: PDZ domain-containing protein [unclassified Sphingomonas]|uniref:PDZ domain-containing protein n=1 Tax=unclassified Sphingomonas TaxID=196159 RepID=UPI0006F664F3|nr:MULTISPECIES: PDZ domain-containing protein [unclassified Sphingomonas]KQX19505.1 signaling protein [Sphingomonas sp. Root1294]KQY65706.1 signaling protein [Sphingomonas sp. Root50]KRB94990.1 signaling protein [Sphingomonas sp. Root720]